MAAYAALNGKLGGAAKDHLAADQARSPINRNVRLRRRAIRDRRAALENRYRDRTARLEWLADGAYPFISEQAIVKAGKVRGIAYIIDASYPQFDGATASFSAVNRQLAAATNEAADRAMPGPDADNSGGNYNGPTWGYEQAYTLHRPGPNAITLFLRYDAYEGGTHGMVGGGLAGRPAHGQGGGAGGRVLPNSNWLRELTRIASADINAADLAELLKEPRRYVFLEDRLELSFNQYEGGPYPSRSLTTGCGHCCASTDRCRVRRVA